MEIWIIRNPQTKEAPRAYSSWEKAEAVVIAEGRGRMMDMGMAPSVHTTQDDIGTRFYFGDGSLVWVERLEVL